MGGECACAVGDCCRVCGLVTSLRQGSVMLGIGLGFHFYAVLCCLWDCCLEPVCEWLIRAVVDPQVVVGRPGGALRRSGRPVKF